MKIAAILLGIFGFSGLPALASDVEFRLVVGCEPGMSRYPSPFSDKKPICVSRDVILNDTNIVQAIPRHTQYSELMAFVLDDKGQSRLKEVTESHIGGQLALMSSGKLITTAVINDRISGHEMDMTLPDTDRDTVLKIFQDRKLTK